MSTKAIVAVIQEMRRIGTEEQAELAVRALAETAAIERSAKGIVTLGGIQPNSEAMALMRSIAKDAP